MEQRYAMDRDFTRRLIRPGTWVVQGVPDSAYTYLLIGEESALVLEPGQHRRNLRAYIDGMTELPLLVANTHGHFDHTGANGQFRDCPIYMSKFATSECKRYFPRVDPADYLLDYEPIAIEEGQVFDLGGRKIEAIAIPCHSPGSLAYLDHGARILFTGDEVESGQVLIQVARPGASVERYRENLLKLMARRGEFDLICPGHNGTPMDAGYVEFFIENCDRIMAGIEGKRDIGSPTYLGPEDPREPETKARLLSDPTLRRSEWKGTSIVYSADRVFASDARL